MGQGVAADEVRALPVSVNVPTAARVLGIGRTSAYRLASTGQLPGVVRYGTTYRVRTVALSASVGIDYDGRGGAVEDPVRTGPSCEEQRAVTAALELLCAAGFIRPRGSEQTP